MLPCLHGGLCKLDFVAARDMVIYLFYGWTLSDISSQQKTATEHGERALTLPPWVHQFAGSSAPTLYVFLALVASGLCHIGLCCRSSNHWNPWREGDLSAQLYKTFMLHQISKDCSDMLTGDPWWNETSPVRNLWLTSGQSLEQRKQSFLSLKWLLERCPAVVGFHGKAIWCLNSTPIFHKHKNSIFFIIIKATPPFTMIR